MTVACDRAQVAQQGVHREVFIVSVWRRYECVNLRINVYFFIVV